MKRVLKILAIVLLVVGSFGGGVFYNRDVMEEAYLLRVQSICEREGVIFIYHEETFKMYFECHYVGTVKQEEQPVI